MMEDESIVRTHKKSKNKRKLRVFRILTFVFAALFVVSTAAAVFLSVNAASENGRLEKSLDSLRMENSSLSAANSSLEAQVKTLSDENDELLSKYNSVSGSTEEYRITIQSLQQQIAVMTEENNTKIAELDKEISTLNSTLKTTKSANSTLTSRNDSLSSEINSLKSRISTLEKERDSLSAIVESLGGTVPEAPQEEPEKEETPQETPVSSEKVAYLTFDDGVSKYTDTILDILAEYNVKATFFPNWKSGNDAKYQRIVNEGHAIGNHTYSHEYDDVYTSVDGFTSEITKLNDKITSVTGYTPVIFRFPGGSNNTVYKKRNPEIMDQAFEVIDSLGMEYYDWNVNSGDADSSAGASKNEIVTNVLNRATMNKAVILMHDTNTKGTTVQALPEVIEGLIKKGYSFSVLTDGSAPVLHSREPAN